MFSKYPINIQIRAMDITSLEEQIIAIRNLYQSGITWELFNELVFNAHNGTISHAASRNSFDIDNWVKHYSNQFHSITTNENQIINLWDYIMKFHNGLISKNNDVYTLVASPNDDSFQLEYIVLKALEI